MVRITEELVRKRSEHNEGEIGSLEELSLHQEDIEKIEYLDKWCKDLQILLLQSNLISKIENVSKLKKLVYLNLALNNIEIIQNLQGCECLEKLDLTLNFIGKITSVKSLKDNYKLRVLYLTGNPCTDFACYREYVVATLPQLECLDGHDIECSSRIQSLQLYEKVKKKISKFEEDYCVERNCQRLREESKYSENTNSKNASNSTTEGSEDKKDNFWKEMTEHSPEARVWLANQIRESKEERNHTKDEPQKKERRLFAKDGRPLNVNESRINFTMNECDETNSILLDVTLYKHMDTSLVEADVQPNYVQIKIKGKILQIVLFEEVKPDAATAIRSQTTGHLLITMPKANGIIKPKTRCSQKTKKLKDSKNTVSNTSCMTKREFLEIGAPDDLDFSNIVKRQSTASNVDNDKRNDSILMQEKQPSADFEDNTEVPALE